MSGHKGSKRPAREIFLTSSSLSFSSLAFSSSVSSDDAIELNTVELNTKESTISSEDESQKNGELSKASSQGSAMSGVTHITMQPAQSPPLQKQPVPLMNKGLGNYNPERIPVSVFSKPGDLNWSEVSSDSLFSLKFDGYRKSNAQASRQSNIKPEEVFMSGDYLRYTPALLVKPGDTKEKRPQMKEIKNGETGLKSCSHQEKSLSAPDVLSTNPNNSYGLDQATKVQSFPLPVGDKKSKKKKKTRKSKKKERKKKKKKKECCMWFWLCTVFSKCECGLRCLKWRKCCCCCRGPKTKVL